MNTKTTVQDYDWWRGNTSKLHQELWNFDVALNESLGGNPGQTISRQTAFGIQQRRPELNYGQAVKVTHGNMALSVLSLCIGMNMMKNQETKAMGLAFTTLGAATTVQTVSDWRAGAVR